MRNDCDINIAVESPSEQSILELRNAQNCYRDLMQTHDELFCRKSKLDWKTRFAPKHNLTEDKIREMEEGYKSVVDRRKKIKEDKGPTQ